MGQVGPHLAFGVGQFVDAVVEAGNGHAALVVLEARDDLREGINGVGGGAAVAAAVQVAVGTLHVNLDVAEAAHAVRDGGNLGRESAAVADDDHVGFQFIGVVTQVRFEVRAADLLLAFQQEFHVHGQFALREQQFHALHVRVGLSLVVGAAARVDAPVADGGLEGRRDPLFQGRLGLHVVVAVDQHGGFAGGVQALGVHDGVPGGRVDAGREAQPRQFGAQELGGGGHVALAGRVGADRGEAQQREQFLVRLLTVQGGTQVRSLMGHTGDDTG